MRTSNKKVKNTACGGALDRDNLDNIRKKFPASAANGHDLSGQQRRRHSARHAFLLQYRNFTNRKMQIPLRGFYPLSLEATESYQGGKKDRTGVYSCRRAGGDYFYRNTTESLNLVAYSYGLNF